MSLLKEEVFDPYPSRILDDPVIVERQDPVLYGVKENGALNILQLENFEKNGFLFFDSLFSQNEVTTLLQEVDNLKTQQNTLNQDYIIREPENNEIRSFFYIHNFNKIFKHLITEPRILSIVRQILASPVYIHQSRINLKPGFKGKEFYWHSDFETWHIEDGMPRMRALSCSITLTDNNEFNGPLMVIPGSHTKYISCIGETPDNHYKRSLRKQEYGVPDKKILNKLVQENGLIAPKGRAGSVLFFDCNIMHGSNSNITPYPRTNVFFVYNSIYNKLMPPYGKIKPRPEYIATRNDYSQI